MKKYNSNRNKYSFFILKHGCTDMQIYKRVQQNSLDSDNLSNTNSLLFKQDI